MRFGSASIWVGSRASEVNPLTVTALDIDCTDAVDVMPFGTSVPSQAGADLVELFCEVAIVALAEARAQAAGRLRLPRGVSQQDSKPWSNKCSPLGGCPPMSLPDDSLARLIRTVITRDAVIHNRRLIRRIDWFTSGSLNIRARR